jgi:hypothetical protein
MNQIIMEQVQIDETRQVEDDLDHFATMREADRRHCQAEDKEFVRRFSQNHQRNSPNHESKLTVSNVGTVPISQLANLARLLLNTSLMHWQGSTDL